MPGMPTGASAKISTLAVALGVGRGTHTLSGVVFWIWGVAILASEGAWGATSTDGDRMGGIVAVVSAVVIALELLCYVRGQEIRV
jgi:hypothetical protein